MKYKITLLILCISFIFSCALMKLKQEEVNFIWYKLNNLTVTEREMYYYSKRDCIIAWKESENIYISNEEKILTTIWIIKYYPSYKKTTWLSFQNGILQSQYSTSNINHLIKRQKNK